MIGLLTAPKACVALVPRRNGRDEYGDPLEITPLDLAPLKERVKRRPGDYRSQLNPAHRARLEREDARAALTECAMPLCKGEPVYDPGKGRLGLCTACASDIASWYLKYVEDSTIEVTERQLQRIYRGQLEEKALARMQESRQLQPGWIYYIRVDERIKIGYSTNVKQRMRAYPPHAQLLAVHPGTKTLERELHQQFKNVLAAGREWFLVAPEIETHIAEVVKQFGEPEQRHIYTFREGPKQSARIHRSSRAHVGRRR